MRYCPISRLKQAAKDRKHIILWRRRGIKVSGILCAADKHFNVIIAGATEERKQLPSTVRGKKRRQEMIFTRELGNVFIRGDSVIAAQICTSKIENENEN